MTLIWGLLFLLFIFIEIITVNLVTIWFACGALVTLFVSLFIESTVSQVIVFIIVSIITLLLTKPIAKRLKSTKFEPTNSDRFVGKKGDVTKKITPKEKGEVKVLGTIWTAASDQTIDVGEEVVVEKIEGVKLIVKKEEK